MTKREIVRPEEKDTPVDVILLGEYHGAHVQKITLEPGERYTSNTYRYRDMLILESVGEDMLPPCKAEEQDIVQRNNVTD